MYTVHRISANGEGRNAKAFLRGPQFTGTTNMGNDDYNLKALALRKTPKAGVDLLHIPQNHAMVMHKVRIKASLQVSHLAQNIPCLSDPAT